MKTFKVHIIRSRTVPLRIKLVLTWKAFANVLNQNETRTSNEQQQNRYGMGAEWIRNSN